ncbi:MAG: sel1 repeat family protein [Prevotella sp.]|nr:sel1 repeat family protein [Prevotella sp.]
MATEINKKIQKLQKEADEGHQDAQYELGRRYYLGDGVERDLSSTIKYISMAASQQHPAARLMMGRFYLDGEIMPCNKNAAFHIFTQLSRENHPLGTFHLAYCYENGIGVNKDTQTALSLYERAIALGYLDARPWAERLRGKPASNAKPQKPVTKEQIEKMYQTGYDYYYGENGKKERNDLALKWFLKAAELGHVDAAYYAAEIYSQGEGVAQDISESAKWALWAARQGQSDAQALIGYYYLFGYGIEEDSRQAFDWLKKAADNRSANGLYYLAMCHEEGFGCPVDLYAAMCCYHAAAEIDDDSDASLHAQRLEKKIKKTAATERKAPQPSNPSTPQPQNSNSQPTKWTITDAQLKEFDSLSAEQKKEYLWTCHFRPTWGHSAIFMSIKMQATFGTNAQPQTSNLKSPTSSTPTTTFLKDMTEEQALSQLNSQERSWYQRSKTNHPNWKPYQHLSYVYSMKKFEKK